MCVCIQEDYVSKMDRLGCRSYPPELWVVYWPQAVSIFLCVCMYVCECMYVYKMRLLTLNVECIKGT